MIVDCAKVDDFHGVFGDLFDGLDDVFSRAPAPTHALFREILETGGGRLSTLRRAGKAAELDRLIAVGAWTDAALVLIALELPDWHVRRLVCEDGAWLCTLSRRPALPLQIDDVAEAAHSLLAVAILRAVLVVRREGAGAPFVAEAARRSPLAGGEPVCCDNFA